MFAIIVVMFDSLQVVYYSSVCCTQAKRTLFKVCL